MAAKHIIAEYNYMQYSLGMMIHWNCIAQNIVLATELGQNSYVVPLAAQLAPELYKVRRHGWTSCDVHVLSYVNSNIYEVECRRNASHYIQSR